MYEFLVAEFLQLVCIPCLGVFYVKSITFYAYSHQFQHKEDFLNGTAHMIGKVGMSRDGWGGRRYPGSSRLEMGPTILSDVPWVVTGWMRVQTNL